MGSLLVVPCFNEAHRWRHEYWADLIANTNIYWLFVNDGSSDGTSAILKDLEELPRVKALALRANSGKGEATRIGLLWAMDQEGMDFNQVGFMDADGAFCRSDIERLSCTFSELQFSEDIDALWSSRVALAGRVIHRSAGRHYLGRAVATYLGIGTDPLPYDTQSGLKFFRLSRELRACLDQPFATRWLFEIEMLTRWKHLTGQAMRVREEPLEFWQDVAGSKVSLGESARIARELLRVKRLQRRRASWVEYEAPESFGR